MYKGSNFVRKSHLSVILTEPLNPRSQSKFEANQSRGSWVMRGKTDSQTPKQRLQLYIYIYVDVWLDVFPVYISYKF